MPALCEASSQLYYRPKADTNINRLLLAAVMQCTIATKQFLIARYTPSCRGQEQLPYIHM